jgi:FkbM family methyltransferase
MNTDAVKRKLFGLIRPLHAPVTRAMRRRLGRNYFEHPEMDLPPAYEAVQLEVERRLHTYLHLPAVEIKQIVIVGANEGTEIYRLRRSYPNARFRCFEPSPQWFGKLSSRFEGSRYVDRRELALSETKGTATFYELPLAGNGSLLLPDQEEWARLTRIEDNRMTSFQVEVSTLDIEAADLPHIDLLWMDVQGAEGNVLKGGVRTLGRVSAVFLEVALIDSPYCGALLYPELCAMLHNFGFLCVGLGIDGANYTGNALWARVACK